MPQKTASKPPVNWGATIMFIMTFSVAVTLVPWYGIVHGYHVAAWVCFTLFLGANGMSITCGYHRLIAHSAYEAHPVLKAAYLFFGAMALQNSALNWAAGHRVHHRFIDDPERDPYCARRGSGSRTSDGCCTTIRAVSPTSAPSAICSATRW